MQEFVHSMDGGCRISFLPKSISPRKGIRIYLSSLSRILAFNAAHLFGGKEAYLKLPHLVGEIHRSKILAHPVSWLDNTDPQRHPHSTKVCESPWHGFRQPNLTSWSQLWLNARMYSMYTIYSCLTYDLDCFSVPLLECFRFHHYNYNTRTYTWEHDHLTLFFSSPRSNKLGKSCSLLARIGTWRCIERYVPCYEPWWGVKHSCCQRWWCVQKWDRNSIVRNICAKLHIYVFYVYYIRVWFIPGLHVWYYIDSCCTCTSVTWRDVYPAYAEVPTMPWYQSLLWLWTPGAWAGDMGSSNMLQPSSAKGKNHVS